MPDNLPQITVQPDAKPWWRSKTLWANVVVLLLTALETQLQILQPLLPVNVYALVAFGLPLVNVALRAVTQQRLVLSAAARPTERQP